MSSIHSSNILKAGRGLDRRRRTGERGEAKSNNMFSLLWREHKVTRRLTGSYLRKPSFCAPFVRPFLLFLDNISPTTLFRSVYERFRPEEFTYAASTGKKMAQNLPFFFFTSGEKRRFRRKTFGANSWGLDSIIETRQFRNSITLLADAGNYYVVVPEDKWFTRIDPHLQVVLFLFDTL